VRRFALLVLLAASFAPQASAAAEPPSFKARAAIVADGSTGEIMLEHNADSRVAIASITKIMTALVTLENARPNERVVIRGPAPSIGESTIHLSVGERVRVRDLLAAALIQSANDAAYALATHVGDGSVKRFVSLMNERAAELGLEDTHFVRPDGLDVAGHYSSANDVLTLTREAMKQPLFRRLVRQRGGRIAAAAACTRGTTCCEREATPGSSA